MANEALLREKGQNAGLEDGALHQLLPTRPPASSLVEMQLKKRILKEKRGPRIRITKYFTVETKTPDVR